MIILLLLSLLTVDTVKVHRAEGRDVYQCSGISDGMGWSTGCDNPHHYIDTCKMRCDTVAATWDGMPGTVIHCYPDTAVDSGGYAGIGQDTTFATPIRPKSQLTAAELSDIREMLREWRVEKCYKATVNRWERWDIFEWEREAIRDSCRCLYERKDVR